MTASTTTAAIAYGMYLYAHLMDCEPKSSAYGSADAAWRKWTQHPETTPEQIRFVIEEQGKLFDRVLRKGL